MQDLASALVAPLPGASHSQADWQTALQTTAEAHGQFEPLGPRHLAVLIEAKPSTLLVSFETVPGIRALSETARPMGWDMVEAAGWSHLSVISTGDTWFRDDAVYAYFDRLTDDGFFDDYDRVVFYGAGPCGYAAAAFSVAAPGAQVVAIQPQATLDPEVTGWDQRFVDARRSDFTSRYGYAPDMLEAAENAHILFDPLVTMDAMHAALFRRPNVTLLPMRHFGSAVQTHLIGMDLIGALLTSAADSTLTRPAFARLMRARRTHAPYLRALMAALDADGRDDLVEMLCRNVTSRMNAPKFTRRLNELVSAPGDAAE